MCYGVKPIYPEGLSLGLQKWNLKPLLLTNLKVHKLESLCTQIWPQYKLNNQNRWPEFGIFDFNILSDLTNFLKQNGKWSEVPYIQASWDLRNCPSLCKDCSSYQILLCFLSPSTTKKSKSKDLKRPPKPTAPDFDPAGEPPSYCPGYEASRNETSHSSPSSSKSGSNDPQNPKRDFHSPSIDQVPKETHVSPQRGSGTGGPYTDSCAFLNFWYELSWRKIGTFFRKSY